MKRFVVVGPERMWVDDILGYGQGPAFPEHDVYVVDSPSRREALWAALKLARKRGDPWVTDLGWEHPLSGASVEDGSHISSQEIKDDWEGLYAKYNNENARCANTGTVTGGS